MSGESLNLYKKQNTYTGAGTPENNFNRPNTSGPNMGMTGWHTQTTPSALFGNTGFNAEYEKWQTSNKNYIEEAQKKADRAQTVSNVFTGITAAVGVGTSIFGLAAGIKQMRDANKASSSNQTADANLGSLTEKADSYGKNDAKENLTEMTTTASNLQTAINTAKQKEAMAQNNLKTAETTITNLNKQKSAQQSALETFDTKKDALKTSIEESKSQLSQLESIPADERTPEQTAAIENLKKQIEEQEKQLNTEFSDEKRKAITDQIERIGKELTEWTAKKEQHQLEVKQLPKEIKEAQKALEKLNKKIMKD